MGVNITVNGKKYSFTDNKKSGWIHIKEWFKSKVFEDYEMQLDNDDVNEVFEKVNENIPDEDIISVRNEINKSVTGMIDEEFMTEIFKHFNIRDLTKKILAEKIYKVILRDVGDLVDNALEDLEDDYLIHSKIQKYVRDMITDTFET